MSDHAQILGIENISSTLILIDRHIFVRSSLLHDGILPSAWMGARSLIGIPSRKIVGKKASSGVRDTHGSVDESLNL